MYSVSVVHRISSYLQWTCDNHGIHTKHGVRLIRMETTWAVLGDAGRSPAFVSQLRLSKFIKALIVAFFDPLYSSIRVLLCGCLRLADSTFDPASDSSLQAAFDSRFDSIQR